MLLVPANPGLEPPKPTMPAEPVMTPVSTTTDGKSHADLQVSTRTLTLTLTLRHPHPSPFTLHPSPAPSPSPHSNLTFTLSSALIALHFDFFPLIAPVLSPRRLTSYAYPLISRRAIDQCARWYRRCRCYSGWRPKQLRPQLHPSTPVGGQDPT